MGFYPYFHDMVKIPIGFLEARIEGHSHYVGKRNTNKEGHIEVRKKLYILQNA